MSSITRWLDVEVGTDEIDLNTLPSNLALVDLQNDNEFKLVVGDLGRGEEGPKLKYCQTDLKMEPEDVNWNFLMEHRIIAMFGLVKKIFRGAMQIFDMVLPDLPLAMVSLHTSDTVPRNPPLIAVAFSSCVQLYRNMKPFYKYYLPSFELNSCEMKVWKKLTDPVNQTEEALQPLIESLNAIPHKFLSLQSRNFMAMTTEQQLEYLEQNPSLPENKLPEIACIATMKHNSVDRNAVTCLVVGSEDGEIIVLDPQNFTQLSQANLCAAKKTPYQMVVTGLCTVDYRITVATREKCVCVLKRDWPEGRILFTTEDHIITIEVMPNDNSVMVICADNTLSCYSKKGKKQWSIILEHRPISLTLLPVMHLGVTLTGVALASGHVYLHDGKARRDSLFIRDVASILKFGQLGQEEHVFVIITASGNLMLKILKRTADFNAHAAGVDSVASASIQQNPWLIPKKSKLFIEQAVRERENAIVMHETFQKELVRLRLKASKTLLEAHMKSDNSIGVGALEPVRLSAEVEGLGPVFRVCLILQNTSTERAVIGLSILFHVQATDYKVSNPYIKVPLLAPGASLKFPVKIEEIFSENINPEIFFRSVSGQGGERALVKVLLLKEGQTKPVLAATVQMPPTDPMMLPLDKIQETAFGEEQFVNESST